MITPQLALDLADEAFIDNFAGGGGASTGIEEALGRPVDAALNHDEDALAMHRMNHPRTRHYPDDIRTADPLKVVGPKPVGGAWFSPDCKHFSKAKGGKPRDKKIRGLAWSVIHWINKLKAVKRAPRVIYLENVEEFLTWCPLTPDGDPIAELRGWFFMCFTGAIFRRGYPEIQWAPGDGFVYRRTWDGIERVPDLSFSSRACDVGAPTIRKRLYLIARSDGQKIVWPGASHVAPEKRTKGVKQWRTMAECIDFRHPCPSIFLSRQEGRAVRCNRPLAQSTLARVAKGVDRYVLKSAKPFIVELTHHGSDRVASIDEPGKTITAAHRGEKALIAPVVAYAQHGGAVRAADVPVHTIAASPKDQNQLIVPILAGCGGRAAQSAPRSGDKPGATTTAKADTCLVSPVLVRTAHGDVDSKGKRRGRGDADPQAPLPTICASPDIAKVAVHLTKFNTGSVGSPADEPAPTITANSFIKRPGGAAPLGMVAAYVAQHNGGNNSNPGHPAAAPASTISSKGAQQQLVATALTKYYGTDQDPRLDEPGHTVTTKDRFGLTEAPLRIPPLTSELEAGARRVAAFLREHGVQFEGEFATVGEYIIVDIGMRMLKPRELFRAQGFPEHYIIDRGLYECETTGQLFEQSLTGTDQVRMCGNSVCPPMARALVEANNPEMKVRQMAA